MEVFNTHKDQLIEAIDFKINKIDSRCSSLKHQIYLYSDQRLKDLLKKRQHKNQELDELQSIRKKNKAKKQQLMSNLQFLKQQNSIIQAELLQKQKLNEAIERQLIFIEEKNKEEKPHVTSYLNELENHKQAAQNIQYAKSKLKQLQSNYQKECQEVQYKYRMIALMKGKLKQMKSQSSVEGIHNKHSDAAVENTEGLRDKELSNWMGIPRATQESCHQQSEGSTFREQI